MGSQTKLLQEVGEPTEQGIKKTGAPLMFGTSVCRHALHLSGKIYCAMLREKLAEGACEGCPHFDPEPLEYRVLIRR